VHPVATRSQMEEVQTRVATKIGQSRRVRLCGRARRSPACRLFDAPRRRLGLGQRGLRCGSERMSMGSADIQLFIHMPMAHEDSQQHGYATTGRCADSKHEAATLPDGAKS